MNTIHEISGLSAYRPVNGDLLEIFEMLNQDVSRSEALAVWRNEGKSDEHFRWVYKRLKERLLKGILVNSFPEIAEHKKRRMDCWRRFAEVKIILAAEKRNAAIELAAEVMREAEKCGMVEVALSLSRDLAFQYGILDVDLRRYRRYSRKVRLLWEDLSLEKQAQELFTELGFLLNKKRDYQYMEQEVERIAKAKSKSVRFNLFRYSLLVTWYRVKAEHSNVIEACISAINFFGNVKIPLPYTSKWHFYLHMIPYLIANQDYALAESSIKSCLALPIEGSHNWHISMLQMAMLGFRSGKPKIAYYAWTSAMEHEPDSLAVNENWEIVFAYLALLEKLGQVGLGKKFRAAKFANSVGTMPLSGKIILMMHYLLDDDKASFMKMAERVPDYLRKEKSARGRSMLRMLAKVEKGDYYRIRVSAMAKRDWSALRRTTKTVSIHFVDEEVILFEKLWEIVLDQLR